MPPRPGRWKSVHVVVVSPYNPRPTPGASADAVVGGVEVALDRTAEALARRGHEVTLACSSPVAGLDRRSDGVRVLRSRRVASLFRTPLSALPFRIPRADVVHVPATYPGVSDLVPLLCRVRRVPCVLDYHFDVHATSRAMSVASFLYRHTLAHGMRAADRVLVKTAEYALNSDVVRRFPGRKLRIVPNGVTAARFDVPAPAGRYVLCVGRLVPYKGVGTLVEAMAILQRDFDVPVWIAGDGPLRVELETRARDLGVDARFLGFVPDEDLPRLYAGAAVTVLPSANGQEAFGITLLESMAAGTPVVASDLPGVRQVAAVGGLTVPPRSPDALADALRRVLKGEARLPDADGLKAAVRTRFDWGAIAAQLEEIYEEVLEERRGGRA